MRPGDHPEFFRFPAPEGRSRESSIVLDGDGRFWHDGELVERPEMARAFARWIRRHPDDGRFVLSNEYDWTYFTVQDVPFFVVGVSEGDEALLLSLFDGTEEPLDMATVFLDEAGRVGCRVKNGAYEARFSRAAQLALEPFLVARGDEVELVSGASRARLATR